VRFALLSFLFLCAAAQAAAPRPPAIIGKAWVVGDLTSGQVLAGQRADERVEPASLTKLMTAYLVFKAMREGKLAASQQAKVSLRAWKQPGSRMFIDPRFPVTVDELVRGMEVHSGNDACVALAEAVAGSEEVFAELMNREASRLGMKDSHFMNATGLPNARHYSTAADLYRLAAALIRDFPAEYAQYYALKEFRYRAISQPNRNRLLWLDPSVDGVKTGHTEAAGWCLIASSRRGGRRLLSVVLGTPSDSARTQESLKLLNWGFQFFDNVRLYGASDVVKSVPVWKGAAAEVKVGTGADLYVTVPRGEADRVKAELVSQQPLIAPLAKGDRVGTLRVSFEGRPYVEQPVVALEPVAQADVFKRAWDTLRLWLK
jgi:D-alanyl-D-alanine carboxypeptidase (penicillin-binding protein 5/6)